MDETWGHKKISLTFTDKAEREDQQLETSWWPMYFPKFEQQQQQQQQQQQVHAFLSKTKEITPLKFSRLQLSLVALVVAHLTHLTMSKRATRHRDWGYLRMETKVCYILAGSIYEYSKPCHCLGDFPVFKTSNLDHFSPAWVPHSTCSDTITDLGLWSNLNRHILHWRRSAHDLKCLYHVHVHIHIYTYIIYTYNHLNLGNLKIHHLIISFPSNKKRATFLGIHIIHHFWTNSKEIFMAPIFFRFIHHFVRACVACDWPWYLHRVRHPATSRTPVAELPVVIKICGTRSKN